MSPLSLFMQNRISIISPIPDPVSNIKEESYALSRLDASALRSCNIWLLSVLEKIS